MQKAMRRLLAMCVALLLLGGCAKKSSLADEYGYRCYESNGQYYITMDANVETDPNLSGGIYDIFYFHFQDFGEMISDIKTCNFSEWELTRMRSNMEYHYGENPIAIMDLDHLLQPVYPEGYHLSQITWIGPGPEYRVSLAGENGLGGISVKFGPNFEIEFMYVSFEYYLENAKASSKPFRVEYEESRNATVLKLYEKESFDPVKNEYLPVNLTNTSYFYTFTRDSAVYYVHESYSESKEGLCDIQLLVVDGDEWAFFSIEDLNERPSIEFLSQFGFEPYKG